MLTLPPPIETQIAALLQTADSRIWVNTAITLSQKYRQTRTASFTDQKFIQHDYDALAYLALRSANTYAQISDAMRHIQELHPTWQPTSILDLGSGPGTAIWASHEIWPSLHQVTCIDRDPHFINIGQQILNSTLSPQITTEWLTIDISQETLHLSTTYDLVIIANVLNELSPGARKRLVDTALQSCQGILLILEPATPYGYEVILKSAQSTHQTPAPIIAPYIDNHIIVPPNRILYFSQRIKRPEFQRRIRQKQRHRDQPHNHHILPASDWETATYCYIAISQIPPQITPHARIISDPRIYKSHIEIELLTADDIHTRRILKRDKTAYKQAKKLAWGDIISVSPQI